MSNHPSTFGYYLWFRINNLPLVVIVVLVVILFLPSHCHPSKSPGKVVQTGPKWHTTFHLAELSSRVRWEDSNDTRQISSDPRFGDSEGCIYNELVCEKRKIWMRRYWPRKGKFTIRSDQATDDRRSEEVDEYGRSNQFNLFPFSFGGQAATL